MPRPPRRDLLLLAVALACVVAATGHKLANGFVWDDIGVIVRGEVIHDLDNLGRVFTHRTLYVSEGFDPDDESIGVDTYRPLTLVTFFVDSAIGGRSPIPYHITNLLAHLACVVLVFFVARRLLPTGRRHLAPLAAAWFGLTPHLAEAHVWIDGRSDLFVTLFGLASLLVYRRAFAATGSRLKILLVVSAVLFFLGLLCKEVLLLALPAFALFVAEPESTAAPRTSRARALSIVPHAVAAVAYLALRTAVLSGLRSHRNGAQLLAALFRAPVLWLDGFVELVVPTRVYVHSMADDYRALGLTVVLVLGALVIIALAYIYTKRRTFPALVWSLFWFVCTLSPAAIIATLVWPGFGRYLYLPFAGLVPGLVSALAAGYERLSGGRPGLDRVARLASVAYLVALGLRLAIYTTDYHDERALWESVIEAAPDRAHGFGYYGATLLEEGEPAAAVPPLRRASELDPSEHRYLSQLGWALLTSGDRQGALDVAATGIHRYEFAGEFHALAIQALIDLRPDLAEEHLSTCLTEEPARPECLEIGARLGLL